MGLDISRWDIVSAGLDEAKKSMVAFPFVDGDGHTHSMVNGHAVVETKIVTWEVAEKGLWGVDKRPKSIGADMKGSGDWIISTFFHYIDGYQEIENSVSDYKALSAKIMAEVPLYDVVEYQTLNGPVSIDMSEVMGFNMQGSNICVCPIDKVMAQGCLSSTIKDQRCPSRISLERVVGPPKS